MNQGGCGEFRLSASELKDIVDCVNRLVAEYLSIRSWVDRSIPHSYGAGEQSGLFSTVRLRQPVCRNWGLPVQIVSTFDCSSSAELLNGRSVGLHVCWQ